jgi:hypothetical protein
MDDRLIEAALQEVTDTQNVNIGGRSPPSPVSSGKFSATALRSSSPTEHTF